MPTDKLNIELARAAIRLSEKGNINPTAEDLAQEHYGSRRAIGRETIQGVRRRLPAIRANLEKSGHRVCLLVKQFYSLTESVPAEELTEAQVAMCLPGGYGRTAEGLHFHQGSDDRLWPAWVARGLLSGNGKVAVGIERVKNGWHDGKISRDDARQLTNKCQRSQTALALVGAEINRALPGPDEHHHAPPENLGC